MRFVLTAGLFACALAPAGCGGKSTEKGVLNEDQQLASLVTEFADTGDAKAMSKYFAGGRAITPAEHKKYIAYNYKMDGRPTTSGDTATATVKIRSASDEKEVGAKEWSFAKEGDRWKLKDAPLP